MATSSPASTRNAVLDIPVPRGLKGLRVAETMIGDVRGAEGFFHYRQYDATELARSRSLEDIAYLLLEGRLPDAAESAEFTARLGVLRVDAFEQLGPLLPTLTPAGDDVDVLAVLRAAITAVAARDPFAPWYDVSSGELRAQCERLVALTAVAVAGIHRTARGLDPVRPEPTVGHAADYLRMVTGAAPDPDRADALARYLALTADHGFNASTFTARVVASTGTDAASAVVAAIGALAGPLHGGAPSRALAMVDEIGTLDNVEPYLEAFLARGERLMGFGHPVYTTTDPRSRELGAIADALGGDQVELAHAVEAAALRLLDRHKPGRGLTTNVEFYAALVMRGAGLPDRLFTPTFAVSRVIGWTAHIIEQAADNRVFRPSATYVGEPAPQPVPPLD